MQEPTAIQVSCEPVSLSLGEKLRVSFHVEALAGVQLAVVLHATDERQTAWVGEVGTTVSTDGTASAEIELGLANEAAVRVTGLRTVAGEMLAVNSNVSVINASVQIADAAAAETRRQELQQEQDAFYAQGFGDPDAEGARKFVVLFVIERMLLTQPLRLPGLIAAPLPVSPTGEEERGFMSEALTRIGATLEPDPKGWHERISANRPCIIVAADPVWAAEADEALDLAREARDSLVGLLALNRGAAGRPVAAAVIPADGAVSETRFFLEDPPYTGNLMGGFLSGEDQADLVTQLEGAEADPLLRFCVRLYSEALAERNADARYLRLWVILETLSADRLLSGQPAVDVTLPDGTPWNSNPQHTTTATAKPRVYQLIRNHIQAANIDERSLIGPAPDLPQAVSSWYDRRNATGHAGGIDHPIGVKPGAALTIPPPNSPDEWLRSFEEVVKLVLLRELHDAA